MAAATVAFPAGIERTKAVIRLIAITVTLATFMELLDRAIANVSLPHIAGGLATSYDEATWGLTSYLVAMPSLPRAHGSAVDRPQKLLHGLCCTVQLKFVLADWRQV